MEINIDPSGLRAGSLLTFSNLPHDFSPSLAQARCDTYFNFKKRHSTVPYRRLACPTPSRLLVFILLEMYSMASVKAI